MISISKSKSGSTPGKSTDYGSADSESVDSKSAVFSKTSTVKIDVTVNPVKISVSKIVTVWSPAVIEVDSSETVTASSSIMVVNSGSISVATVRSENWQLASKRSMVASSASSSP